LKTKAGKKNFNLSSRNPRNYVIETEAEKEFEPKLEKLTKNCMWADVYRKKNKPKIGRNLNERMMQ
jgi:hypothetical protein